jgi:hypothetical protein
MVWAIRRAKSKLLHPAEHPELVAQSLLLEEARRNSGFLPVEAGIFRPICRFMDLFVVWFSSCEVQPVLLCSG